MHIPQPSPGREIIWSSSLLSLTPQPAKDRTLPISEPPSRAVHVEAIRPKRAWLRIQLARPLLTLTLIAVLVVIYIPMAFSPDINQLLLFAGAKMSLRILEGEWWRLLTSTFLHGPVNGIPFIHLLLNAYALFMIGLDVEAFLGRARFATIYVISGLAGSVASFAVGPFDVSGVGASGAIFGLIGALAVYFGLHRTVFGMIGHIQFWNIILVIVLNVAIGFANIFPVDNSAHLGGLIAGAAVGYVLCPRYALGEWTQTNVRELVNTNRGALSWAAAGLIALNVVLVFVAALLLFKAGILRPTFFTFG